MAWSPSLGSTRLRGQNHAAIQKNIRPAAHNIGHKIYRHPSFKIADPLAIAAKRSGWVTAADPTDENFHTAVLFKGITGIAGTRELLRKFLRKAMTPRVATLDLNRGSCQGDYISAAEAVRVLPPNRCGDLYAASV